MIRRYNDRDTVWLGEGDIGTCLILNEDGQAIGIGFKQLIKPHVVGEQVEKEFIKEDERYININFANQGGIESLLELINSFLERVGKDNEKGDNDESQTTPKV